MTSGGCHKLRSASSDHRKERPVRRVIAHFRKQQWTAIFIDFLIVVLGVFVGIQVSNWNSARIGANEADAFLVRIEDDVRENRRDLGHVTRCYQQTRRHGEDALAPRGRSRPEG